MKITKSLFTIILFSITFFNLSAQESSNDTVVQERLFTDKDNDFLQLWYFDQVLKMDLDEDGRYDYLNLLQYYTFKMTRLSYSKYNYTDEEQKTKFDQLVERLDSDMKDYLNENNYAIHKASFGEIVEMVYKKKGWEN